VKQVIVAKYYVVNLSASFCNRSNWCKGNDYSIVFVQTSLSYYGENSLKSVKLVHA